MCHFWATLYVARKARNLRSQISVKIRSSAISEKPARHCVSVQMLSYCCTNIANRSRVTVWEALSATATFYSATCIVLYTQRYSMLHYLTASMQYSVSHRLHVTLKWAVRVINRLSHNQPCWCQLDWINKLRLPPTLLTTPRIPPPAHHCGRRPLWQMDTNYRQ